MTPPPAEPFATRLLLGPALRAQPDRRLVTLVREGYESAFEEIVRRYRKPLDRFAASIVGGRSEDVTQDAFSKALLALRGAETDIELRPWLYRIVRNTALNELRDHPPSTAQLEETLAGGMSVAGEAEDREEMAELMDRLRALPEPQRAAIVMRELEGLSHEEIAAALGVSGGAARQAIYRARMALRNGLGMLVPLPLLRLLFDHGAEAAAGGAAAAGIGAGAAGGGAGVLGGIGAGGALKVGVATVLVAGTVGAGVAIKNDHASNGPEPAAAASSPATRPGPSAGQGSGSGGSEDSGRGSESGDDHDGGSGSDDHGGRDGGGGRGGDGHGKDHSGRGGRGSGDDDFEVQPEHSGDGGGHGGGGGPGPSGSSPDDSRSPNSGKGSSGGSGSGSGDSGSSGSGSGSGSSSGHGSGSGGSGSGGDDGGSSGGSGSSGSGSSGSGSSGEGGSGSEDSGSGEPAQEPPPPPEGGEDGGDSGGSGSGGPGSGDSGSGGGGEDD